MSHTIKNVIQYAIGILEQADDSSAKLDAELLLASVLEKDRTWLRTWPEKILTPAQKQAFEIKIQRRLKGEPIAYILGQRGFWSLELTVTPATLIPRPETELLVEQALLRIPEDARWSILDLGTGSGAIALAIAKERPHCHLFATDQSLAALRIAQQNAHKHTIHNIQFLASHWLSAFNPDFQVEMILSNPPYIMEQDPHLSAGDVRFEPISALAAGPEGLDDLQTILITAKNHLQPGGWLLLEHGYHQQTALTDLLIEQGYQSVQSCLDCAGLPRLSLGKKKAH